MDQNSVTKQIQSEAEMLALGTQLAREVEEGAVIFLYGPLGAGKTTFTRGFLRGLGFADKVKSPTYALVEAYEINGRPVFHFDFYRITDPKELEDIGIQEYFSPESICLIEWPEKGISLFPEPDLACYIEFTDEGREVNIEPRSDRGLNILRKM